MLCAKSSSLEQLAKTVVAKAAIVNNLIAFILYMYLIVVLC